MGAAMGFIHSYGYHFVLPFRLDDGAYWGLDFPTLKWSSNIPWSFEPEGNPMENMVFFGFSTWKICLPEWQSGFFFLLL